MRPPVRVVMRGRCRKALWPSSRVDRARRRARFTGLVDRGGNIMRAWLLGAAGLAIATMTAPAAAQVYDERPATVTPATQGFDYERRIAEIPMRDGVTLHTVILVPKGARRAPILLTRTPYEADALTANTTSSHLGPSLYGYDNATDVIVEGGYIRVVQDVRGKYKS